MSDQAPETGGRRRGNAFTRRIGPLPMWQWFLIALAMIGVYVIFEYRKKNAAAAGAASSAAGTPGGGTIGGGQVPQFVNQTYTYVAPPSAQPAPPSVHPIPPTGGGGLPAPGRTPPPNPNVGETIFSGGRNLGQYQVGQAQVSYIQSNVGKFGITSAEAGDVAKAYQNAVSRYGQQQADSFHYSWNSPGNVTAQIGSTVSRVL